MTTALRPVLQLFRPAAWYDTAELATRASIAEGGELRKIKGVYYKTNAKTPTLSRGTETFPEVL